MIRGMFVLLADNLYVIAVRALAGKLTENRLALRLEGAGTDARRKLAFGIGFSSLHAISLYLFAGLGLKCLRHCDF